MIKLKDIKTALGATLNKQGDTVNHKSGYQVGKQALYTVPVYKLRKGALKQALAGIKDSDCLGVWIDNGKAYVDISEHIASLADALKAGRARGEISIYDWAKDDIIYC